MPAYRPRRSSTRWSQDAPEYVLACYDNGGRTCDRYTVMFGGSQWEPRMGRTVFYLGMSGAPTHPQGFSQLDTKHGANDWEEIPGRKYRLPTMDGRNAPMGVGGANRATARRYRRSI